MTDVAEEQTEVTVTLPWQGEAWAHLTQQIDQGTLPHALLIAGIRDIGKGRLAMALARRLLCHTPTAGYNCGHCHACQMSRVGNHGDFRWLEPEGKGQVIKVDRIREVVEFANKTASLGQRKVVVFAPAENMNANAANALLKVLEEPPADTYMLLLCHRPHGLPATIRSRCQVLRSPAPGATQALDWLDTVTGSRADSQSLLDLADGRPLRAAAIYQQADADAVLAIPAALQALHTGQGAIAQVAQLLAPLSLEESLGQFAHYLQRFIRCADAAHLRSGQYRGAFELLDEVGRLQRTLERGGNPNPQMQVDALLARFTGLLRRSN